MKNDSSIISFAEVRELRVSRSLFGSIQGTDLVPELTKSNTETHRFALRNNQPAVRIRVKFKKISFELQKKMKNDSCMTNFAEVRELRVSRSLFGSIQGTDLPPEMTKSNPKTHRFVLRNNQHTVRIA